MKLATSYHYFVKNMNIYCWVILIVVGTTKIKNTTTISEHCKVRYDWLQYTLNLIKLVEQCKLTTSYTYLSKKIYTVGLYWILRMGQRLENYHYRWLLQNFQTRHYHYQRSLKIRYDWVTEHNKPAQFGALIVSVCCEFGCFMVYSDQRISLHF